jgi:hypothetical protein
MMRYFFHIREGDKRVMIDTQGVELADIGDIRSQAVECAHIACQAGIASGSEGHYQVEVSDNSDAILFSIRIWPSLRLALMKRH